MSAAERFIEELLDTCPSEGILRGTRTGLALLHVVWRNYRAGSRAARELPVDGFRAELTAHNQRGQLLRHLRLHGGLALLGPPGKLLSWLTDRIDRKQAESGRLESLTEVRDNEAGRSCGAILRSFLRGQQCREAAREALVEILVEDGGPA